MRFLSLIVSVLLGLVGTFGNEPVALELLPQATVGSKGIYLEDIAKPAGQLLPKVHLASPPAIGRPITFSRYQINDLLVKKSAGIVCTNWTGPDRIRITRATRQLEEAQLKQMLVESLQEQIVKDRGELELRFTRPWNPLVVPDEMLSVRILELPASGVGANFICRFEIQAAGESVGIYQQPLNARIWRDVYVAKSNLIRGQLLRDADVALERRDLLSSREVLTSIPLDDPYIELRENVPPGSPLSSRMFRLRAVVKRGRVVEALLQDDVMTISVKAEALEDGVPGQVVRLRNPRSKREFKGKVQDEQTVLVLF